MTLSPSLKQDGTVLKWEAHGRETRVPLGQHSDHRSCQHRTRHGAPEGSSPLLRVLGPQWIVTFVEDKGHHQILPWEAPTQCVENKCPGQNGCLQTQPLTGLSCTCAGTWRHCLAHTMLSTGPVEMTRVMSKAGYGRRELTCMTATLGSPADQTGPVSAGLDGSSLTPALWDL